MNELNNLSVIEYVCNTIEYLYSAPPRYPLRGALCSGLHVYDVKCYERTCLVSSQESPEVGPRMRVEQTNGFVYVLNKFNLCI